MYEESCGVWIMAYTTIDNPELYFQVKTYSGNGSADHAITLDGEEDMQPDLVWQKRRNDTNYHVLYDSVRGATKYIYANTTGAETTNANGLTAFGSNGFTLGNDGDANHSSGTHVAWCWKESATAGFDIVSYTGNGSNRTISHSLSAVPKWMMHKDRDNASYNWGVYHHKLSPSDERNLNLNTDGAANVDSGGVYYNSTDPTSSVFSVGTNVGYNASSDDFIAYLWSEKQGFSKFGSYLAEGNADGVYVNLGFRPAFLMIKNISSNSTNWHLYDNKRLGYNVDNDMQRPNLATADQTDDDLDLLSNGFKIRRVTTALNTDGETYVYMAFAEQPFVNSKGVPANAR
jgi:hypothetical protein